MARKAGTKKPLRKSKAQSATGAKENEVEVRTAGIGDNSQLPIPAPEDFDHHKKTILGWREKVTTAQGHLRNAIKIAKKAGINMEALNMVVDIERENDPAKTLDFFRQVDLGLEHGQSTLRLTVHDTLAGDEMELIYKRGFNDGKNGRGADNRYPENSELHAEYARGWRHGTADNLGVTPEESDAAIQDSPEKIAAE